MENHNEEKQMFESARKVDIVDFMEKHKYYPIRKNNVVAWYFFPLSKNSNPNFRVSIPSNTWYDYGTGKGGNVIDLCKLLYGYDELSVIKILSSSNSGYKVLNYSLDKYVKTYNHVTETWKVSHSNFLDNPELIKYLHERGINIESAQKYCSTVFFTSEYRIRRDFPLLYAIGLQNNSGGWELCGNSIKDKIYFQACTSPKDITIIHTDESECVLIFNGFIDFLSYLTYCNKSALTEESAIILNSSYYVNKAIRAAANYKSVELYFQNNDEGRKAADKFMKANDKTENVSISLHPLFRTLNDFINSKK